MEIEKYLTDRVEDQLGYYESAANKAKKKHLWIQNSIIVMGLLVPVIVNLPDEWGPLEVGTVLQVAVTLISLSLAILTGISNFRKYGDLWLSYRMTEELIKQEKFLYLTASGLYQKSENASSNFVQRIESIISAEHNKFRTIIEDDKRPTTQQEQAG